MLDNSSPTVDVVPITDSTAIETVLFPSPLTARNIYSRRPRTIKPTPSEPILAGDPSSSQSPCPGIPTKSPLFHTLPLELLLLINGYLPVPSQIALTLTCKSALDRLGTSSWDSVKLKRYYRSLTYEDRNEIQTTRGDRTTLFKLISNTTPGGSSYCQKCDVLHPPLKPPATHRINKKHTLSCLGPDMVVEYLPFSDVEKGGYSLVWYHVKHALEAGELGYLNGEFEHVYRGDRVRYSLSSEAKRINGNVVLKHVHRFAANRPGPAVLTPADVLELPFRICPHQSTSTDAPLSSKVTRPTKKKGDRDLNAPLFTHTLVKAFPARLQSKTQTEEKEVEFKKPTPMEQEDMEAVDSGEKDLVFRCRSCPTKWKVEHDSKNGGALKVTTWHCFYEDIQSATKVWPWLVRREDRSLGRKKRNSEFWKQGRSIREFEIE
ncbi:hypothetical protein QBC42DRAFT_230825 [Cladorrhinum samala]|uniref:F-box domain-containing protein n=1 Tax=Cladorrhinum samala TaxID=585594 RepID=A0AAV9HJE6_9PEZI|nr:hypothetical protein QBC42DRAFT_230825 [Cladorrhinum samala]